jgi:beta-1,4-glucosyltransferase
MHGSVVLLKRNIAGFEVRNTTFPTFARFLRGRLKHRLGGAVFFANANFVVRCAALLEEIEEPMVFTVPDGVGINIASRLLYGAPFRANLNGTDFVPGFLRTVPDGTRLYLIGGRGESLQGASGHFGMYANLEVVGACDGYSLWSDEPRIIQDVIDSGADIVLVALGNPLQEQWILRNQARLRGKLVFGVGALFDFLSGTHQRAPEVFRKLQIEWLYRLMREPRRLCGRYTIGIVRFLWISVAMRRRAAAARKQRTSASPRPR